MLPDTRQCFAAGMTPPHGAHNHSDARGEMGHLHVRVLGQLVGAGETSRAGADDDHIALRVLVQVLEVTAGHGAADLQKKNSSQH